MFSGVVLNYLWLTLIVFSSPDPSGAPPVRPPPRSCGLCVPIVTPLQVPFTSRECNSILLLCIKRAQTGPIFFGIGPCFNVRNYNSSDVYIHICYFKTLKGMLIKNHFHNVIMIVKMCLFYSVLGSALGGPFSTSCEEAKNLKLLLMTIIFCQFY